MATYNSHFRGTITINGVELPLKNVQINASARIASTQNSLSGGFPLRSGSGGKDLAFSATIDYDFDNSPFALTPAVTVGAKLTNAKIYEIGTSGVFWGAPSVVISATKHNIDHMSTSMLNIQIDFLSDGAWTYPGGVSP